MVISTMNVSEVDLRIEKVVSGGLGLGFYRETAVFVPFTAPGDRICAKITKQGRNHAFAQSIERLEAGPERIDPGCDLFTRCGGCHLRHLTAFCQKSVKEMFIKETLERFPNLKEVGGLMPMLVTGQGEGYRRRAGFKVRWLDSRLLLGFFQVASHYIADISAHCPILETRLDRLIRPLRAMLVSLSIKHKIPQVDVVAGDKGVGLIVHVLAKPTHQDRETLRQFALEQDIEQLYLQRGQKNSIQAVIEQNKLYYSVEGETLEFYPRDFIQAHKTGNQRLVKEVITQAGEGSMAWDLFCGIGNFTLPLTHTYQTILGVESYAPTLKQAKENARHTPTGKVRFSGLNLFQAEQIKQLLSKKPADVVVLDPPREGAMQLIKGLITTPLQRLVYVSCNPATFARDAALLVHGGFRLQRIQPIDMFPQTFHVELVALFVR